MDLRFGGLVCRLAWSTGAVLVAVFVLSLGVSRAWAQAPSQSPEPIVGALRWDAWIGESGGVGAVVETSLGPKHWHYRLPFFARVISDTEVEVRGNTQAIVDQEITLANQAGLSYWAFVSYPPTDPMSYGLEYYLASKVRGDLKFCLIVQGGWVSKPGNWPENVEAYVELFRKASYQKVLNGRPLMYLFMADSMVQGFGGTAQVRRALADLRSATAKAALAPPYIVLQGFSPAADAKLLKEIGADALSAYCVWGGTTKGAPYSRLMSTAKSLWDQMRKTGAKVVPITSTGWDRRPRVENPVPWENGPGDASHYLAPTPAELTTHLADALAWNRKYPEVAEANTVLMYAWNEIDEGGWLLPTLQEGDARLKAVRAALEPKQ